MKNEKSEKSTKVKLLPDIGEKPHQPNIIFKKTVFAGTPRSFHHKYFLEFPWLHYNETEDKVYCSYCVKCIKENLSKSNFSKAEAFTYDGFNYWNKIPERFRRHQNSEEHKEARCKISAQNVLHLFFVSQYFSPLMTKNITVANMILESST